MAKCLGCYNCRGHLVVVLSSNQHTVKPWFDGKVDFTPSVKDFSEQDFHLYGGRLEYLNNRAVAALVYQRRLHYINLYMWSSGQAGPTAEVATQRQGYNLMHWASSGIGLLGDLRSEQCRITLSLPVSYPKSSCCH